MYDFDQEASRSEGNEEVNVDRKNSAIEEEGGGEKLAAIENGCNIEGTEKVIEVIDKELTADLSAEAQIDV